MMRIRYSPEQIIARLQEAEVLLNQAKRFKELEQENERLQKLAADPSLDKAILSESLWRNS